MPMLVGVSGHSNHRSPSGLAVLLGIVCLLWDWIGCRAGARNRTAHPSAGVIGAPIYGARILSRAPAKAGREEKREDDPSGRF